MPDEDSNGPDLSRRAVRLNWWQRGAAGAVALVLFTVSSLAVLDDTDGSAVLALVIVAGIFAFLAVAGVIPTRLQSGEQSMELYDVMAEKDALIDAAAEVMSTHQMEAADKLTESSSRRSSGSSSSSSSSSRWGEYAVFERAAIHHVRNAATELGYTIRETPVDGASDAVVETPDGRKVYVLVKYRIGNMAFLDLSSRAMTSTAMPLLVVTDRDSATRSAARPATAGLQVVLNEYQAVRDGLQALVGWRSPD